MPVKAALHILSCRTWYLSIRKGKAHFVQDGSVHLVNHIQLLRYITHDLKSYPNNKLFLSEKGCLYCYVIQMTRKESN